MKRFLTGIFLFLIVTGSAPAQLGWQQLGPNGARINAMAGVPGYPDELFIAVGRFPALILRTTNTGTTWTAETIPDIITALAVNPVQTRIIYAAGKTSRVYKSTNSGATWQVAGTIPGNVWIQQLFVNPENPDELWAGGEIYHPDSTTIALYYSDNGGITWQVRPVASAFAGLVRALAVKPDAPGTAIIGGTLANRGRLFLTTDYGNSWQDIATGITGTCVYGCAINPTQGDYLLCATDSGIYYSTDLGNSWTHRLSAPVFSVAFAPVTPYYAYAGGENLLYRSTNQGWTWQTDTTTFFGTDTRFLAINPQAPLELYAGNAYGVFHTTNGGSTWNHRTANLKNLNIINFQQLTPDTIFAFVEGYGAMRSINAGVNWQRWGKLFPGSGWARAIAVNPRHPDTMALVTLYHSYLHLTIDAGDSWETHPITEHFQPLGIAYHPTGPDTLFVWGGKGDSATGPLKFAILRSSDRGQTWQPLLLRDEGTCYGMIFTTGMETLYAYGKSGNSPALFRSTDRGRNWTSLNSGITATPITDLKPMPNQPATWFCTTPAGVFKTENQGLTWDNLGLPGATCILPDTINPNRFWVGTDTQGVFYTTNNGLFWDRDTVGITGRSITFLHRHPWHRSTVFLGVSGHSLAGKNVLGIAETSQRPSAPQILILPSAITSSVRIILPPGTTRLTLYNPTGRLICRIPLPKTPSPVLNWQRPRGIGPGVYLFRAEGPGHSYLQRVLLLPVTSSRR